MDIPKCIIIGIARQNAFGLKSDPKATITPEKNIDFL